MQIQGFRNGGTGPQNPENGKEQVGTALPNIFPLLFKLQKPVHTIRINRFFISQSNTL